MLQEEEKELFPINFKVHHERKKERKKEGRNDAVDSFLTKLCLTFCQLLAFCEMLQPSL